MRLSDFGLCKPLDCRNISPINEDEPIGEEDLKESVESCGPETNCKVRRWRNSAEQLQHWQINRRKLVLYSPLRICFSNVFGMNENYYFKACFQTCYVYK